MKTYLTYALNKEGNLVHIDSVSNGNDCGCFCPHCKSKLCAKNGSSGVNKAHHFAHLSGADCVGAIESALHKMAKNIMRETLCIQLPNRISGKKGELLKLDRVEVEFYDRSTRLRPDCIGYYGDKIIWIEFKRTHAVDTKKRGKIISANIDCVELDINSCILDPDAVRKFIVEENENRIWIRDTQTKQGHTSSGIRNLNDYCDYYGNRRNHRIFAFEDNRTLVNLLYDKCDMNLHSYSCIACGNELTIDVDEKGTYSFIHINKDIHCEDNLYLHEAAKEILHRRFISNSDFEILVPQNMNCEEKSHCTLFHQELCSVYKCIPYNLKDHGYIQCVKNCQLPGINKKLDLVIKNVDSINKAIIITIKAENYSYTIDTNNYRVIEIYVYNESSLINLMFSPIGEETIEQVEFINFKQENYKLAPCSEIDRRIMKFSLFSSGKYHVDAVPCVKLNEKKKSTVIEHIFVDGIYNKDAAKSYSLLKCYEQKRKACYCEICWFIAKTSELFGIPESICKRYKTKGTPHYPLKIMPIDCPYFSINKKIVSIIKNRFKNIHVIENYFID